MSQKIIAPDAHGFPPRLRLLEQKLIDEKLMLTPTLPTRTDPFHAVPRDHPEMHLRAAVPIAHQVRGIVLLDAGLWQIRTCFGPVDSSRLPWRLVSQAPVTGETVSYEPGRLNMRLSKAYKPLFPEESVLTPHDTVNRCVELVNLSLVGIAMGGRKQSS